MARMGKLGWNPCEEMKIPEKGKKLVGNDEKSANIHFAKSRHSTIKEESNLRATRTKTLARAARSEVPRIKEEFKSKLPALTADDVRRHRLPYCDSVILELDEEGFRDSAEYLSMLFELDEEMRKKAGPGSLVWKKPRLKSQKSYMERLRSGLTAAETAKRSGNLLNQAKSLLDTALFFDSATWEWFWIAEQLFKSSLKIAENLQNDDEEGLEILNFIRFLYGRFLFIKMNQPQEALDYLDEVRIASEGKKWSASRILGVRQETLYRESCNLLHKALLTVAQQARTVDPEMSVRAAEHALKRAKDSVHDEYVAAALYELGKSQLSSGDIKSALGSLSKFLAMVKRIPDPEGVCNAHMELAFAYKELEDSKGTVKHLALLRECASQYKLSYKLAQAHYSTGEYLLNKVDIFFYARKFKMWNENQANSATPHLQMALSQFNSLGKATEANRARCAAGVSKGQEIIDRYINLILDCELRKTDAITKICLWKSSRVPFWTSTRSEEEEAPTEVNFPEDSFVA